MGNWRGNVGEDEGAMGRQFRSLEGEGVRGDRGIWEGVRVRGEMAGG
jgi:hypothetical protein